MATPSSSTTTPSPRPRFLQAAVVVPPSSMSGKDSLSDEQDDRQRTIQKFLASAELAQLARGLRTRLAYASFKATHNLTHTTLPDLEAQAQCHATSAKLPAAKVPSSHYNNPVTQGSGSSSAAMSGASSSKAVSRKGAMLPPTSTASATQSLYASLLQPPPSKRARTIHNPQDPPLAPPSKPRPSTPSPRKTPSKATSSGRGGLHMSGGGHGESGGGGGSGGKTRRRRDEKGKRKGAAGNAHSEGKTGTGAKGRSAITPQSTLDSDDFANNEDVDMKAAATLTSLLHSRPSKSATASSPRSSMSAGSDGGSTHSYASYAQSSARSTAPTTGAEAGVAAGAGTGLVGVGVGTLGTPAQDQNQRPFTLPAGYPRATTPPPRHHARTQSLPHQDLNANTTPKGQIRRLAGSTSTTPVPPSDSEAADLMLFLATSPSPVRPSADKEKAKDPSVLRSLSGSSALRGRVLFGQGSGSSEDVRERGTTASPRPLQRDSSGSFNSVATEIVGDVSASPSQPQSQQRAPATSSLLNPNHNRATASGSNPGSNTTVTEAPQPLERVPTQLLPAPSSPIHLARSRPDIFDRPRSVPIGGTSAGASPTPVNSFNLHEYLNVSPSPASAKQTSLRADVGRRLFEEHLQTSGSTSSVGSAPNTSNPSTVLGAGNELDGVVGTALAAGIDLVKSPA